MKKFRKNIKKFAKSLLIAAIAVIVASLIRKLFLSSLEDKVVWITFYPAVMIAAILGGFFSGMLSSIFALLITLFGWSLFIDNPFISGSFGTISSIVFMINCSLISGISGYSRQQKIKADIQKDKAEKASQAKSNFLANISHELRTPLNAILGFTRIMQLSPKIPKDEQKNLEIVNRSGEHLLGLINNVLDIAKIESGQIQKNEITFNPENAIYEVSQLMNQRAEAKNLKLKTKISGNLSPYIKTDKQKLKQILINLTGNAIKFTEKGSVSLRIKEELHKEKKYLIVEVEDTGIGINKTELEKIFKPFVQSSLNTLSKGTGLGLAISKQYAELLGGSITAESKIGKGSKFTLKIPVNTNIESDDTQLFDKYLNVDSVEKGQKEFRILIVEDQIENWLLLKRIHENVGLNVKIAENGLQAIEKFKQWNPEFIWMDIRMPVMDGLEATKEIRKTKNGKDVKIVGISAHVFKDEIQNMMDAGMNSFVKKPYQFHEIYETLNEQLNVKFTFNNKKEASLKEETKKLSLEMFENVDSKLLNNFKKAIKTLDTDKIDRTINQIQEVDNETAQILLTYTRKLKYTEIYRLLNSDNNE